MRAAVLHAARQALEIDDVHVTTPKPHEVLVQVVTSGVCHTDLDVASGRTPADLPIVLGHEAAGVVIGVGRDVTEVAVGDHVVGTPAPGCGRCDLCRTGRPFLCPARQTRRGPLEEPRLMLGDGTPVGQLSGLAGFAEQMLVHESAVVAIDPAVPWTAAAVLGCGALTGVGAVLRTARLRAGARAAVIGLGGVGLAAVQACRLAGAERIVAVDIDPAKLDAARRFGATDVIETNGDGASDDVRVARAATRGGADFAFDCVGTAHTLESAYDMTRNGGTTVLVGGFAPGERLSVSGLDLVIRGKTITGSSLGSSVPKVDIPVYANLVLQGRLPLDQLVSDRFTLDDCNEAMDRLRTASVIRAIMDLGK